MSTPALLRTPHHIGGRHFTSTDSDEAGIFAPSSFRLELCSSPIQKTTGSSVRSLAIRSSDKAKLDEYLTSVPEVEKRVEAMRKTATFMP